LKNIDEYLAQALFLVFAELISGWMHKEVHRRPRRSSPYFADRFCSFAFITKAIRKVMSRIVSNCSGKAAPVRDIGKLTGCSISVFSLNGTTVPRVLAIY